MMRCSPEAFARCSTRALCGSVNEATFTEGSECDKFNRSITSQPITNADRIRAMSDEELAQAIYEMVQGSVEGLLEMFDLPARIDSVVRVEPYKKRLLSWLQQSAEEVQ